MHYTLTDKGDYLRADLLFRETAAETEDFLHAVRVAALAHRSRRVLIYVHSPRALFRIEKYHASDFLDELASRPEYQVALVARHFEVRLVQQYVEVLARLKQAPLRSFPDEASAIKWLTASGARDKAGVADRRLRA